MKYIFYCTSPENQHAFPCQSRLPWFMEKPFRYVQNLSLPSGVVKCLWKVVWKIEVENGIFLITFGCARYILLRLFGGGWKGLSAKYSPLSSRVSFAKYTRSFPPSILPTEVFSSMFLVYYCYLVLTILSLSLGLVIKAWEKMLVFELRTLWDQIKINNYEK